MFPGVLAVAAEGADVDVLWEVQLVQGFGEEADSVVDEGCLSLQEYQNVPLYQILLLL